MERVSGIVCKDLGNEDFTGLKTRTQADGSLMHIHNTQTRIPLQEALS